MITNIPDLRCGISLVALLMSGIGCGGRGTGVAKNPVEADQAVQMSDASSSAGSTAGSTSPTGPAGSSSTPVQAGASADAGLPVCSLRCEPSQTCELVDVTCVRAPCPPQPTCVDRPGDQVADQDCDLSQVLCRAAAPTCPAGQTATQSGSCYGPCVAVERCACSAPEHCPNREEYTCHLSAGHCGPYVR